MDISLTDVCALSGRKLKGTLEYGKGRILSYPVKKFEKTDILIVHEEDGVIRIDTGIDSVLEMACDRCLTPVDMRIRTEISRKIDVRKGVDEDGDPVDFLDHDVLLLDELIEEAVSEVLPMKVLCTEECKGLCPVCGKNLNDGPCGCQDSLPLTPMQEALLKAMNQTEK